LTPTRQAKEQTPIDSQHGDPRLFSLAEAREMMPALREAMRELQRDKKTLDRLRRQLRELTPAMRGNGHAGEPRELEERIHQQLTGLRKGLEAIGDAGVMVKDIDMGLVDFPSERDGHTVYLCWMIEEPDILFWHPIDGGYGGRQPL
jgi:hypothetical protein